MITRNGIWVEVYGGSGVVPVADIPVSDYSRFFEGFAALMARPECHCVNYFAYPEGTGLLFVAMIADDSKHTVNIASYKYDGEVLPSLSNSFPALHSFEREIAENYGVEFPDHPWLKPLRYCHDRADHTASMNRHPFYSIESDSLHEVVVGPIHAGIIEPGVFRFTCNGEEILHLETMHGYQHRGIEKLMVEAADDLRRTVLAESIAGDSTVAHTIAYCRTIEALNGGALENSVATQRAAALEMERMAMHIADTGALCGDIGYQTGQVACEALRTVVINSLQLWCGNRFGKGLIRPWGSYYPVTAEVCEKIAHDLEDVLQRYSMIAKDILSSPSVLSRFEDCGVVTSGQMSAVGGVGMAARAAGLGRDIRNSHPCDVYGELEHMPVVFSEGDVMARVKIRMSEVKQSGDYITTLLKGASVTDPMVLGSPASISELPRPIYDKSMAPDSLSFSLVEGWRGEVCHTAVTDDMGRLKIYKIKDPSLHNWLVLSLAVRGMGISDFPICNKSFDLSYSGHDL